MSEGFMSSYSFQVPLHSLREVTAVAQGRNQEAGVMMSEAMMEALFTGMLGLLSYAIQDHLPRAVTTHNGWSTPTSIINQDNTQQNCLLLNR